MHTHACMHSHTDAHQHTCTVACMLTCIQLCSHTCMASHICTVITYSCNTYTLKHMFIHAHMPTLTYSSHVCTLTYTNIFILGAVLLSLGTCLLVHPKSPLSLGSCEAGCEHSLVFLSGVSLGATGSRHGVQASICRHAISQRTLIILQYVPQTQTWQ
jgi:hypothetical protein